MVLKLKNPEKLEETLEIEIEEEYTPPRALEIPPMPDSDQYVYRWIRFRNGAEDDFNNITARMREGWVFVKEGEIPANFVFPGLESKVAALAGCATNGDLVLGKLPRAKAEAIRRWSEDMANNAEQAFNQRTVKHQEGGRVVRFDGESSKRVTTGRRPQFG